MMKQLRLVVYPAFIAVLLGMPWTVSLAGAQSIPAATISRPSPFPIRGRDSRCQLSVVFGSSENNSTDVVHAAFQMNGETNVFYNVNATINSAEDSSHAGGNYLGDVAEFSIGNATTIYFNPQTSQVIDVKTLGIDGIIQSSQVSCRPALKAPSCAEYLSHLYQQYLPAPPAPSQAAAYLSLCTSGHESRDQIMVDILQSPAFVSQNSDYSGACNAEIDTLSIELLYKPAARAANSNQWYGQCVSGPQGLGQVAEAIITSPEYQGVHSSSSSTPAPVCSSAPSAPAGLIVTSVTSSGINLSWAPVSAPPGCTITGYTVYENGKAVQTVQGTSFNIQQLSPSTSYAFTVAANDSAGVSPQSGSLSVKTQGAELNVATSITNLCADTQSYVSLEDLTSGAKGNLSTTCIGATNVRPGQTVNALCPASTQAQGNGYGVWRANFTDNVTGAIHSNPNSVGSVSGFVLLNATEVNAALQSDCKTVTLTYKLAQTAPAGTGNGGAAAPASLALPTVQAPDSLPAFRYYTGSAPNSYTVLESGSGQQKLKSLKKAAQQVNPDLGSPDLMPHDVSAQ